MFLGKLEVFTAAIDAGFAGLAILAVINTVASLFYYLRWIAPAFLAGSPHQSASASPAAWCRHPAWAPLLPKLGVIRRAITARRTSA